MAKVDDVQRSVDRLEKASWVVLLVLLGWLGALSTMIYNLHGDLQAAKQKIADGGTGAVVSALQHPTSPQQLAANLSLVSSQVRVARVEGKKPDPGKVRDLSEAIDDVVSRSPEIPEAWQAAAELISIKSPTVGVGLKPCAQGGEENIFTQPRIVAPNQIPVLDSTFFWHDCSMALDDNPILKDSVATKEFQGGGAARAAVVLKNVRVIYRGGEIPEFDQIVFENCSFDFVMPGVPSIPGRKISENLLLAGENKEIKIELSRRGLPS